MHNKDTFYRKYGKRMLDFFLSLIAIIILCPVLLITAIIVRANLGNPVLFHQLRPGKNEKIFRLNKFRTMKNATDNQGQFLPDHQRMTAFGKKLRSTSLDELPELFNILKGDMSIVGPRPLLIEYLPLYSDEEKKRHNVRPGLTGLAQISGRNATDWDSRLQQDVYYVNNYDFFMDLKIIFNTFKVVVLREGITSETSSTKESLLEVREKIK